MMEWATLKEWLDWLSSFVFTDQRPRVPLEEDWHAMRR